MQTDPTLLGPTMLWLVASVCMKPQQRWHLLALVAYSLKPVKLLGPCKRMQHCGQQHPTMSGPTMLWLVASVCMGLKSTCFFRKPLASSKGAKSKWLQKTQRFYHRIKLNKAKSFSEPSSSQGRHLSKVSAVLNGRESVTSAGQKH